VQNMEGGVPWNVFLGDFVDGRAVGMARLYS
jgi:hypothetical protein